MRRYWMGALIFVVFVVIPLWGIWGAYRSFRAWEGCEIVGVGSGYGYVCKDGRKYP